MQSRNVVDDIDDATGRNAIAVDVIVVVDHDAVDLDDAERLDVVELIVHDAGYDDFSVDRERLVVRGTGYATIGQHVIGSILVERLAADRHRFTVVDDAERQQQGQVSDRFRG